MCDSGGSSSLAAVSHRCFLPCLFRERGDTWLQAHCSTGPWEPPLVLCLHGGFDGAGMPSPAQRAQLLLGAVPCMQRVAFSLRDDRSRLAGNGCRVGSTTVQPRTYEAESPREPGHQLYVTSSINSTLKMTVSLWFSNAIPVLVLGQVLCFPLRLPDPSPRLRH